MPGPCPYCKDGKIESTEVDPTGRKVYKTEHPCHKCDGTCTLNCEVTVGDQVAMSFTVVNLHPCPDGTVNAEIAQEGERSHFAIVPTEKLARVSDEPARPKYKK